MNAAKELLNVLLGKEVKQLSPNTQAVYEAAIEQATFPDDAEWAVIYALRAAADQVVPKVPTPVYCDDFENAMWTARDDARNDLLAIADELEATT